MLCCLYCNIIIIYISFFLCMMNFPLVSFYCTHKNIIFDIYFSPQIICKIIYLISQSGREGVSQGVTIPIFPIDLSSLIHDFIIKIISTRGLFNNISTINHVIITPKIISCQILILVSLRLDSNREGHKEALRPSCLGIEILSIASTFLVLIFLYLTLSFHCSYERCF